MVITLLLSFRTDVLWYLPSLGSAGILLRFRVFGGNQPPELKECVAAPSYTGMSGMIMSGSAGCRLIDDH